MKKSVFIKKIIDTSKYVNIETGELLSNENEKITSFNQSSDMVTISSNEYIIIDSKARKYVEEEFNHAEAGRIFQMCDMVESCFNLLFDKKTKHYHTKDTLMNELDYTRNKFSDFLKKLFNKSIIYYIRGVKDGKECLWIMLNPTLARKSKTFHKDCIIVFTDLSKQILNKK